MTQEKIETVMTKVKTAAVWYGMYIEKLSAKEKWELQYEVYERTMKEIEVLLND
tara:strand:+ start:764 stop:925 length:162 start_codon:yes stop_codon:yes gene_type:complete